MREMCLTQNLKCLVTLFAASVRSTGLSITSPRAKAKALRGLIRGAVSCVSRVFSLKKKKSTAIADFGARASPSPLYLEVGCRIVDWII
jgi:hypothetical protein